MPEQFIENLNFLSDKEIIPKNLKCDKSSQNILVIKKINDNDVNRAFVKIISWLITQKRKVFIINQLCHETNSNLNCLEKFKDNLFEFNEESQSKIDLIITIGGDGTYLYACSLFQSSIPPIMPFHLGSLGFLTRFSLDNFENSIQRVWNGEAKINYRSRLLCKVIKNDGFTESGEKYLVLNDIVIDRGLHPFLSNVDLFINDHYITTLQGDGLIIATPTGSTAYSAAAGASMIHPSVPGIVITPICPHSLSFRPIVVPPDVDIKIKIAPESRNSGFVCLDGRHRQELKIGDTLQITSSQHSVPSLILDDETQEWFDSLIKCLRWNDRVKQKAFH